MPFVSVITDLVGALKYKVNSPGSLTEHYMKPKQTTPLATLKQELEFLDHSGYRNILSSRQPLFCMETGAFLHNPTFIEDSPSCPKEKYHACNPEGDCFLLRFVPADHRRERLPCHHIPLNEKGETISSFERQKARDKVEPALRSWLVKTIEDLQAAEY
jgi:hypothetical protein